MKRGGPASKARPPLHDKASAKVNLTLRILGRRADGYHEIESLVVFADVGDRLTLRPGGELALIVRGPLATHAGPMEENLVVKAARALAHEIPRLKAGRFTLTKYLPAQAGLGGGSADAAAALRLLAHANRIKFDDPRLMKAARATGADVPVCLDPKPRWMRGLGEILSAPVELPRLFVVLVRPNVALATSDVFKALGAPPLRAEPSRSFPKVPGRKNELIEFISGGTNDLESPATKIAPAVALTLASLCAQPGCQLARMSGSGSACFGIFATRAAAQKATRSLAARHKSWWVKPVVVGSKT
ncbi:MAG: 4-(cytidine 5'-diphospho)-2-C-methyl-D-erythritol kinase [Xanthobacteraceae bacterium]